MGKHVTAEELPKVLGFPVALKPASHMPRSPYIQQLTSALWLYSATYAEGRTLIPATYIVHLPIARQRLRSLPNNLYLFSILSLSSGHILNSFLNILFYTFKDLDFGHHGW